MSFSPKKWIARFGGQRLHQMLGAALLIVVLLAGLGAWSVYRPGAAMPAPTEEAGLAKQAYVGQHLLGFSGPDVSPDEAEATERTQEAYTFAVYHQDVLKYMPCYCGCALHEGHRNNLDCFIKDVNSKGEVLLDRHAADCQLCIDIALDAKRLKEEGTSLPQIRQTIDEGYGQKGPGTKTPLPPA